MEQLIAQGRPATGSDKPFIGPADGAARLDSFTRVESFGDPDTHWLRIRVEPGRPELFDVEWEIVEANRAQR